MRDVSGRLREKFWRDCHASGHMRQQSLCGPLKRARCEGPQGCCIPAVAFVPSEGTIVVLEHHRQPAYAKRIKRTQHVRWLQIVYQNEIVWILTMPSS